MTSYENSYFIITTHTQLSRRLEEILMVKKGLKIFFSKLMSTQWSIAFPRKSLATQRFRTVNVKFYQSINQSMLRFSGDLRKDELKHCLDIISEKIVFKFTSGG